MKTAIEEDVTTTVALLFAKGSPQNLHRLIALVGLTEGVTPTSKVGE